MNAKVKLAVDTYVKIERNLAKLQGTVLDLLAHPNATGTQCLEAARSYRALVASVNETRGKVLKACGNAPMSYRYDDRVTNAFKGRRETCR